MKTFQNTYKNDFFLSVPGVRDANDNGAVSPDDIVRANYNVDQTNSIMHSTGMQGFSANYIHDSHTRNFNKTNPNVFQAAKKTTIKLEKLTSGNSKLEAK